MATTETTAEQVDRLEQQLDDLNTPDREWVAEGLLKFGKLQIADRARRMADNQRVLNTSIETDRAYKALGIDMARWNFDRVKNSIGKSPSSGESPVSEVNGKSSGLTFPKDEEMQINIDSPTIVTHHHPAPPATTTAPAPQATPIQAAIPVVKKGLGSLATAAIVAGSIGTGAAATYFMTKPIPPAVAPADAKDFSLDLLPPDKKTP